MTNSIVAFVFIVNENIFHIENMNNDRKILDLLLEGAIVLLKRIRKIGSKRKWHQSSTLKTEPYRRASCALNFVWLFNVSLARDLEHPCKQYSRNSEACF